MAEVARCRSCGAPLSTVFCDLGRTPLSNAFRRPDQAQQAEPTWPLKVWACDACHLVQLEEFEAPAAIFSDYAYFSSYSESWVSHAARYVADVVPRFGLGPSSLVVEVASNDGYLLKHLVQRGVPVLGIEPAANVARVAEAAGVPTRVAFFGEALARDLVAAGHRADLLVGNNVLAHVPDLLGFLRGVEVVLSEQGVASFEFPHLERLVAEAQFDTIYHEHFSYFSLLALGEALRRTGLEAFDVEELPTHGGSLRVWVSRRGARLIAPAVDALIARERASGLDQSSTWARFASRALDVRLGLLEFLVGARRAGKRVVAYGAAAKGNTLLNTSGVGRDLVEYVVDRNPHKQGLLLPGSAIPVYPVERLAETRPDYVLILPWNLEREIREQMAEVHGWGGRFVIAVPTVRII